jgi:TMEM175 potassium channel family protein
VWIAHSTLTRFIEAADPDLMRLNLLLLLLVSFLPFTTAIAATHLFASNLSLHEVTVSSPTERVAVVLFGLNLTLAALMVYLMLRHAGHTPDVAADDLAEEELQAFARERRSAVLFQASATVVGVFLPLTAWFSISWVPQIRLVPETRNLGLSWGNWGNWSAHSEAACI